ncbi:MAG: type I restriction enzyme HsdR N-terminal domain-containing protein [Lachnospiraceae bacterium]|nr:type I restriction enzyme HsdR N-terminal domain-containing protein [Lachnospiraceae bacterium]
MRINIENQKLPDVYIKSGRECYLDPVRKKLIYITPEETVRQQVVSYLIDVVNVPKEAIFVEERLSHYHIESKRRADIIVHGMKDEVMYPILIVECKSPDVYLDEKAHEQVFDYCNALGADYAVVCNGYEMYCYKYSEAKGEYEELNTIPSYLEILDGKGEVKVQEEQSVRIPFEKIEKHLTDIFAQFPEDYYGEDISKTTPMEIAKVAFNLQEALYDVNYQMPVGDYGIFRLIEDYGIRMLSYGNAGGGQFFAPYRSFLIEYKGSTEFVSFAFSTYTRTEKNSPVKTCMSVAHDNEKETHHALQLVFDDNVQVVDGKVTFYHSGRIAVGNIGSGKIDDLRAFVEEQYPKIVDGKRFNMGTLMNDHLWNIDQPDVIEVIVNCISYALIRDEYREYVKQRKK